MTSKIIKSMLIGAAVASMAAVKVSAVPIEGSVGFSGAFTTDDPTTLAGATMFTSFSQVLVTQATGDYSAVPGNSTVSAVFNTFTFSPATLPTPNLWSFSYNGVTYSFTATTETSEYIGGAINQWVVGGMGIASIAGGGTSYDDTMGTWQLGANQSGESFTFASTAAVSATSVPDYGSTLTLLGTALAALGLMKFRLA